MEIFLFCPQKKRIEFHDPDALLMSTHNAELDEGINIEIRKSLINCVGSGRQGGFT